MRDGLPQEETFGREGHDHYLDNCGDGFIGLYICQNI